MKIRAKVKKIATGGLFERRKGVLTSSGGFRHGQRWIPTPPSVIKPKKDGDAK